jgi:predicted ABC-type ATPase
LPHVIVISGPNGAGKSTTAPAILKGALGVTEFVNADTWHVFDNSRESDPQLIATHDSETGIFVNNQLLWEQIRGEY